MRNPLATRYAASLVTISWLALVPPCKAESPAKACIAAHTDAQVMERDHQLLSAAVTLRECQLESCPALIRSDCEALAARVRSKTPSLRVLATEADGAPVALARLTLDGVELYPSALERGFALDPGSHQLNVYSADGRALEQHIEVVEGEQNRELTLHFQTPPAAPAEADRATEPSPTLVYGLAAGSAAGFGAFAIFALNGKSTEHELERCAPNCAESDVGRMRTQYLIADVSLGVGIAAAAVAAYVHFKSPGRKSTKAQTGLSLHVTPTAGNGGLAGARLAF